MESGSIRQLGVPPQAWAHPTSEWAVRFVGFTSVVDAEALSRAGVPLVGATGTTRWAWRPEGFRLDPAGPARGVCVGTLPRPQALRLRLEGPSIGTVDGVAGMGERIEGGTPARVRFVPEWSADLPPAE